MFPTPLRRPRAAMLALVLVGVLGACGGPNSTAGPSTPASSGAACVTAPAPPTDLEGWDVSSQNPTILPVLITNAGDVTCGRNRLLFTFLSRENLPVGAPDRAASIAIYNLGRDADTPIATADGTFIWAIEDERGIYATYADLPEAGVYGAEFSTAIGSETPEKIRYIFEVQASSPLVKVGQRAPTSTNPTIADVGGDVARVSTDADPDPRLYETSVAKAIADNEPFLVAFATPKFCKTVQCGPTLDRLKPFVDRYPSVTFINIEPYELKFEGGSLQPVLDPATSQLVPVAATNQWGLKAEPWVFVVDRDGIIVGSFALIFSDAELTAALDAVK
jgi:hypothetical protein